MNINNSSAHQLQKHVLTNAEKCKAYRERKKNNLTKPRTAQYYELLTSLKDEELKPCTVMELIRAKTTAEVPLTKRQIYDIINNERRRRSKSKKKKIPTLAIEESKDVFQESFSNQLSQLNNDQEQLISKKRQNKQNRKSKLQIVKWNKHSRQMEVMHVMDSNTSNELCIHDQKPVNKLNVLVFQNDNTISEQSKQGQEQHFVIEDTKMAMEEEQVQLSSKSGQDHNFSNINVATSHYAKKAIHESIITLSQENQSSEISLIKRIKKRMQKFGPALKNFDKQYNIDYGLRVLESCVLRHKRVTIKASSVVEKKSSFSKVVSSKKLSLKKKSKGKNIAKQQTESPQMSLHQQTVSNKEEEFLTSKANIPTLTYKLLVKIYNQVEKVVNIRQCLREKLDFTQQRVTRRKGLLENKAPTDLGNAQIGYGEL